MTFCGDNLADGAFPIDTGRGAFHVRVCGDGEVL
jgi:hypothetical protein